MLKHQNLISTWFIYTKCMFHPYKVLHSLKMTRRESKHFGVTILYVLVLCILLVLSYIIIN